MEQPRVLIFLGYEVEQEPHQVVQFISQLQSDGGVPFRILVTQSDTELTQLLGSREIEYDFLPTPEFKWTRIFELIWFCKKLFRYYQMYPFEMVHAFGNSASFLSSFLKLRFNAPLVWYVWNTQPGTKIEAFFYKALKSFFCDELVTNFLVLLCPLDKERQVRQIKRLSDRFIDAA